MSYEIRPGRPEHDSYSTDSGHGPQVGAFHQGSDASQTVLRRYLLTRAIGASIVMSIYWLGIAILVVAALVWLAHVTWLAVLIGILGIVVLLVRGLLAGIQRRISGVDQMGSAGPQVERMVGQTRKGLRKELRRIGLPSAPWGPLLVALRLVRPIKRVETVRALSRFDLTQVVPTSTLDELHLILASTR